MKRNTIAYSVCLLIIITLAACLVAGAAYQPVDEPEAEPTEDIVVVDVVEAEDVEDTVDVRTLVLSEIPKPPVEIVTECLSIDYLAETCRIDLMRSVRTRHTGNCSEEEQWEPSDSDIAYVSRTVWGEVRGCDYIEQRAQVWCILNRVDDSRWPDTIAEVVLAPNQFQGYSINNPVEPFWDLAREILILWHDGVREIPEDMCFCSGKNGHQTFRTDWIPNENTRYYP